MCKIPPSQPLFSYLVVLGMDTNSSALILTNHNAVEQLQGEGKTTGRRMLVATLWAAVGAEGSSRQTRRRTKAW